MAAALATAAAGDTCAEDGIGTPAAAAEHYEPPSWQRFYRGFHGRFVEDVRIELSCGAVVTVAQAPAAVGGGGGGGNKSAKNKQQQQKPKKAAPPPPQQQQARLKGRHGGRGGKAGGLAERQQQQQQGRNGNSGSSTAERPAAPAAALPAQDREKDPALTGTTVWDGAIVLGQYLASSPASPLRRPEGWRGGARARPIILELGAGTGAVSLCALAAGVASGAILTDIPEMLPHLRANVERNAIASGRHGGGGGGVRVADALVAPYRWADATDADALAAAAARRWPPPVQAPDADGDTGAVLGGGQEQQQQQPEQQQQQEQQQHALAASPQTPPPPPPPWDVIVGSDLIYYSYTPETPHSRLLLAALRALADEGTLIVLSLSLHHNPKEVEAFLAWAARVGFDVARVPPGDVPAPYSVPDVIVTKLLRRQRLSAEQERACDEDLDALRPPPSCSV